MGSDSSAVENENIARRREPKIFRKGDFLMGYCHSFRFGQIIQYYFNPPVNNKLHPIEYLVTKFVPELISVLEDNNFTENDSNLIICYDGHIFYIDNDWHVGWDDTNYHAIGSGALVALGSLHSTAGKDPQQRMRMALEASENFITTVCSPFHYLSL